MGMSKESWAKLQYKVAPFKGSKTHLKVAKIRPKRKEDPFGS